MRVIALILLLCSCVYGAVAFDTATTATAQNASSLTWTHTAAASLSNGLAIVGVGLGGATVQTVTGVTYGGVAMTQWRTETVSNGRVDSWYLINPAAGSQTVIVTLSGSSTRVAGGAETFTGVNQTTALAGSQGATTTAAASISITITSTSGDMPFSVVQSDGTVTVHTTQTQRWAATAGARTAAGGTDAGAASVVLQWDLVAESDAEEVGGNIQASAGGAAPAGFNKRRKLDKLRVLP